MFWSSFCNPQGGHAGPPLHNSVLPNTGRTPYIYNVAGGGKLDKKIKYFRPYYAQGFAGQARFTGLTGFIYPVNPVNPVKMNLLKQSQFSIN